MAFAIPSDTREIVLYWWKILDCPEIQRDLLYNFIAFDLFLASFSETKLRVEQAIKCNYLIEDENTEMIRLHPDLLNDFQQWQNGGILKAKKMQFLLAQKWREPISNAILTNMKYESLLMDLIDMSVYSKSSKMKSSSIKLNVSDIPTSISGEARDTDSGDQEIFYPFIIDLNNKIIKHNCPEFQIKKNSKQLCCHLSRLIIKLYANDNENTIKLLQNIVHQKNQWKFE